MINVTDRVPTKPNRIKLIDENTGISKYYTWERADLPVDEGTPINKVLFDSIKADLENKVSSTDLNNNLRNYYNKVDADDKFSEKVLVKTNITVTPTTNSDSSTNSFYPFKATVTINGVTSTDIADASLGMGVTCDEFEGTNTVSNGVELLFSANPNKAVQFSYISVMKGSV